MSHSAKDWNGHNNQSGCCVRSSTCRDSTAQAPARVSHQSAGQSRSPCVPESHRPLQPTKQTASTIMTEESEAGPQPTEFVSVFIPLLFCHYITVLVYFLEIPQLLPRAKHSQYDQSNTSINTNKHTSSHQVL